MLEPALSSGDDDRKINFDGDGNSEHEHEQKLMRGVIYQDWNNELPKRSVIQNDAIHSVAEASILEQTVTDYMIKAKMKGPIS